MKKNFLFLLTLVFVTSCNPSLSSSIFESGDDKSSFNSDTQSNSSSTIIDDKNLEDAIELLQLTNVSFKTTCKMIYEPKTSEVDEVINTFGARYNYYDYEKFEFEGYTNDALVASYIYYANSEKYAVTAELNLMNQVEESYLTYEDGGKYYKIPWGQSTYYNLFKDLSFKMFSKIDDYTYTFSSNDDYDLETITLLVNTLTGMSSSSFTYDSVYLNLNDDYSLKNITFNDKGSNDNPDYHEYYQFVCEINSYNDVDIKIPTSYEHNDNVNALQNKIDELKTSDSYTVNLNYYDINLINNNYQVSTSSSKVETSLINKNDIYLKSILNNETSYNGYHSHDNGYGYFVGDSVSLNEHYFISNSDISSLIDLFNFSADIFYLDEKISTSDMKVYKLHDNSMSSVISEFYYSDYSSLYSYLSEIQLVIKDDTLYIYFDVDYNSSYYYLEFSFTDINSTSISDTLFSNYINYKEVSSFKDERLKFKFENEYNDNYKDQDMSFDTFFSLGLGTSSYDIPLYKGLNPYMDTYFGGVTYESETSSKKAPKYADISIILYDYSYLNEYELTLKNLGYKQTSDYTGNGHNYIYVKNNIIIGFTIDTYNGVYGIGYSVLSDNFIK